MNDNIKVNPSLNNNAVKIATDDINNVHYPVYKHAFGEDGSVTLVNADNPLPVAISHNPKENDTVLLLNEICKKLDVLIQYQAMLHKIDLT